MDWRFSGARQSTNLTFTSHIFGQNVCCLAFFCDDWTGPAGSQELKSRLFPSIPQRLYRAVDRTSHVFLLHQIAQVAESLHAFHPSQFSPSAAHRAPPAGAWRRRRSRHGGDPVHRLPINADPPAPRPSQGSVGCAYPQGPGLPRSPVKPGMGQISCILALGLAASVCSENCLNWQILYINTSGSKKWRVSTRP